ncbi:hypothetical protein CPB85DRAFT_941128 [Mucidula mucida]|nr:hypothetical protein CPB85DRAFT_941128 [Mucidula mucida]
MVRTLEVDREWVHAGVRVRAKVTNLPLASETSPEADANTLTPDNPTTTADSDPSSEPVVHVHSTNPLTPLLSFGKFLELVIYSPRMKSFLDAHPNSLRFKVGNRKQVTSQSSEIYAYIICVLRVSNPIQPLLPWIKSPQMWKSLPSAARSELGGRVLASALTRLRSISKVQHTPRNVSHDFQVSGSMTVTSFLYHLHHQPHRLHSLPIPKSLTYPFCANHSMPLSMACMLNLRNAVMKN